MSSSQSVKNLISLLKLEGLSGKEGQVATYIEQSLLQAGAKKGWIRYDHAHKRIGKGFEIGNLIVRLPGTKGLPRLLFCAHLDTVPLCRGVIPTQRNGRIVAKGKTALGGDNRAGVACLLSTAQTLLRQQLPHPPITFLFTVGEEMGLRGSCHVSPRDLGFPIMGFNFDGSYFGEICIGAIGADRWEVHIHGLSAHAGKAPQRGISAAVVFSGALALMEKEKLVGAIKHGVKCGTSNIGIVQGEQSTNQVLDYLFVRGESRSHNVKFLTKITSSIERCFRRAATLTKNDSDKSGRIEFTCERHYAPYRLSPNTPVVKHTLTAMHSVGLKPRCIVTDSGLDASYLTAKSIPTVTLGAGAHLPHQIEEYVVIDEYLSCCDLALKLSMTGVP